MLLNRLKAGGLQLKPKPKVVLPSPSNRKSQGKTKEKPERCSPRANRVQTLGDKKPVQCVRKSPVTIVTERDLLLEGSCNRQSGKGLQTPKFKGSQQSHMQQALHNFFSFGEAQQPTDLKRKLIDRDISRNKENVLRGRQVKQSKVRKEAVFR